MSGAIATEIPDHVPAELVSDYAFETQPGVNRCPFAANQKIHELPDIFYATNAYRGSTWVITSAEFVREAYTRPDLFTSNNATGFLRLLGRDVDLIPVEVDPPKHGLYRQILNPHFTPAALNPMEESLRRRAESMIDELLKRDEFEFETQYGRPYPVRIFLDLMGLPSDRLEEFVSWEEQLLHGATLEDVAHGAANIMGYLEGVIPERRKQLGDDLLSTIIGGQVEGQPLSDEEILATSFLLFFGGLDTVAATLAFIFKHLAEHPEDQKLLRDEPQLITGAVEEFLRAYSVVNSPRRVAEDTVFHGVAMKKGDRVMLAATLAGRDPESLPNADKVDLRRIKVRHLAFASGPHLCLGAPLARRELRISLEAWLTRAPMFEVSPNEQPITRARGVFDVQRLPLRWVARPPAPAGTPV